MPTRPINLVIAERPSPKRGESDAEPDTSKVIYPSLVS